jgi:hypothetical protein
MSSLRREKEKEGIYLQIIDLCKVNSVSPLSKAQLQIEPLDKLRPFSKEETNEVQYLDLSD